MSTSLSLADIDAAGNAVKEVTASLDAIGRAIYKLRNGKDLGSEYDFSSYSRIEFEGCYFDQVGPEWAVGMPIFSLEYYWSRPAAFIIVTFPQSWLEKDWETLEKGRIAAEKFLKVEQEKAEAKQRAIKIEESERKIFERLKAKFEPE